MNPLRILGAAANVFFIAFLTGSLARTSIFGTPFSPFVTLVGSVLLYGIAISALMIYFGQENAKVARNAIYGSVAAMLIFTFATLARAVPEVQEGITLMAVWATINVLALGFSDSVALLSIREQRRKAAQKRKLDLLRTKNPNESDNSAS